MTGLPEPVPARSGVRRGAGGARGHPAVRERPGCAAGAERELPRRGPRPGRPLPHGAPAGAPAARPGSVSPPATRRSAGPARPGALRHDCPALARQLCPERVCGHAGGGGCCCWVPVCGRQQGGPAQGAGGQGALAPCLWLLDVHCPLCTPFGFAHTLKCITCCLHSPHHPCQAYRMDAGFVSMSETSAECWTPNGCVGDARARRWYGMCFGCSSKREKTATACHGCCSKTCAPQPLHAQLTVRGS